MAAYREGPWPRGVVPICKPGPVSLPGWFGLMLRDEASISVATLGSTFAAILIPASDVG